MLSLTRRTEYALIALWQLARSGSSVVSARDLAEQHSVPLPLLMNVLKELSRHNIVKSSRGANGGYSLSVAPRDLTLRALIEVLEGPVRLARCIEPENGDPCDLSGCCPIRVPVHRIHERLARFLGELTLEDLMIEPNYTELGTPRLAAQGER